MRKGFAVPAALTGSAMLLAFLPIAPPTNAHGAPPSTVRIGLLSSLFRDAPEPLIQVMARPFTSLMEDQAGFTSQVVVDGTPEHLAIQLKEGKVQLGVFNGFEFAWARAKDPDLKPLIICVNQQPFLRSVLVVRQNNMATDPTALAGKKVAISRIAREHTRIYLERRCVGRGVPLDKWYAKVTVPPTAQAALDDLADDLVQGAVVDDVEFAAYRKAFPKSAARLRVLAESETFPCAVIAYHPGGMNNDTLKKLHAGLIAAKTTPRGRNLLDLCRITGFEAVPDNYEKLLIDIFKAYPPLTK